MTHSDLTLREGEFVKFYNLVMGAAPKDYDKPWLFPVKNDSKVSDGTAIAKRAPKDFNEEKAEEVNPYIFLQFRRKEDAETPHGELIREGIKAHRIGTLIGIRPDYLFDISPATVDMANSMMRRGIVEKFKIPENNLQKIDVVGDESKLIKKFNSLYPSKKQNWKVDQLTFESYRDLSRIKKESVEKEENEKTKAALEKYFPDGKFIPKLLGDDIKKSYFFRTLQGSDKNIYIYRNGVYLDHGKQLIGSFTTNHLSTCYKKHHHNEVISYIINSTYIRPDEIDHEWINLKNGLLNPMTGEFIDHTPDIFSLHQIPIEYDPKAKCPQWEKFIDEQAEVTEDEFNRKDVPEDWKVKTLQEMFGYTFLKDQRFQKAFLLFGEKRTAKSTTLNMLERVLGKENTSSISLHKLTADKYAPAYLFGVSANICADITSNELKNTGTFMIITGGDSLQAGAKYQNDFKFKPYAKLIFSCNVVPGTTNKEGAFYRRWVPIEFNQPIPEDKADPNFLDKLIPELPGILNWSLAGLDRLLEQKKFSCPYNDDEIKDIYERNSNSVQSFIFKKIDGEDDEGKLKKREVYGRYKEYCKDNKLPVVNQVLFGRLFKEITGCGTGKTNQIPAYFGVNWKENELGGGGLNEY